MAELLIEIGTEEIPAGYIPPALAAMAASLTAWLEKNQIRHGAARTLGTPRRLAVWVPELDTQQPDVVEVHHGPNVKIAYDPDGNPTKAAQGFARGKGVDLSALTTEDTPKGQVICARVEKKGQPVADLLNTALPEWVMGIPFPKKMRWGEAQYHPRAFVRPIHWIAAVFDGKPLAFEVDGISAGNTSRGHRFLKPGTFSFLSLSDYLDQCQAHQVLVDPESRRQQIQQQVAALAQEVGGQVKDDPELLETVTHLVEFPVPLLGEIDPRYLALPVELMVITMKHHQKYFPVWKNDHELLPYFITVSNTPADGGNEIIRGNQRVLKARLEDARFFYEEDQKQPLESYVDNLKGVVFQKDLGTLYEKVGRIKRLTEHFEGHTSKTAGCAAQLCKADLTTQMVFEFPELQGIIGGYYARNPLKDEGEAVALAIKEHYKPAFAGDTLPSTLAGKFVALADKLDTIVGCISVGLIPSGSEDPYALRRHAMGCIEILNKLYDENRHFRPDDLIKRALMEIGGKKKLDEAEISSHAMDLFRQRFKTLLSNEGFEYDVIDAVLANDIDSFRDSKLKVTALSELKRQDYFESLAIAFRRVVSILEGQAFGAPNPDRFPEPAEQALWNKYLYLKTPVEDHIAIRNYGAALAKIVEIKPEVDAFFDQVMVNVDDAAVRDNRKALLFAISRLFAEIADFSKIVVKKS